MAVYVVCLVKGADTVGSSSSELTLFLLLYESCRRAGGRSAKAFKCLVCSVAVSSAGLAERGDM